MLKNDYLLRQIERLVEALAQGKTQTPAEIDNALMDTVGLNLRTIDGLSPSALAALLAGDNDIAVRRREALAQALDALAPAGPDGDARRAKAAALRQSW